MDSSADNADAQNIEDKKINLQYIFFCRFDVIARKQGGARMSALRCVIASDDDVDAASAQNGKKNAGDHLLSHTASRAVPSTQKSLTSEFGMGSGMASSLLSPARLKKRFRNIRCSIYIYLASPPPSEHFRSEGAGRRLSRTTD